MSCVDSIKFTNFGSHCDDYPVHYLTVACAIGKYNNRQTDMQTLIFVSLCLCSCEGMTKEEVDVFIEKFDKLLTSLSEKPTGM